MDLDTPQDDIENEPVMYRIYNDPFRRLVELLAEARSVCMVFDPNQKVIIDPFIGELAYDHIQHGLKKMVDALMVAKKVSKAGGSTGAIPQHEIDLWARQWIGKVIDTRSKLESVQSFALGNIMSTLKADE